MRIAMGEFLPDQAPFLTDGLTAADGVMPTASGYAPIGQLQPVANSQLPAACVGAGAMTVGGATYIFGATSSAIYRYYSTGFAGVRTGLTESLAVRFQPYARLMLATNGNEKIQKYDTSAPAAFTDLSSSAPSALFMAVCRGVLIAGYADGNSTRVRWSDIGDPTNWTAGGASYAGAIDLTTGGDITAIVGGEYALIFQEQRIVRMTFTGDDALWQFDEISTNLGCTAPGSVSTWGKLTFFLSSQGFMVCDGVSVTPIGQQKVDQTYTGAAVPAFIPSMSSAIDPTSSTYAVTLANGFPASRVYLYNWILGRWSTFSTPVQRIFQGFAQGMSLEDLDAIYSSLDAMPVSLDSPSFKGGKPLMLAFDGTARLGTFSGSPQAALLKDCSRELVPMRRARVRSVRPLTDATTSQIQIDARRQLGLTPTTTTYVDMQGNGLFRMRHTDDYTQIGLVIPSGTPWTFAQGFDVDVIAGGRP